MWVRKPVAVVDELFRMLMPLNTRTQPKQETHGPQEADRIIRLRACGGDWRVRSTWEQRICDSGAPNWFALEDEPRAKCIKSGHHRRVWLVSVDDRQVYAKVVEPGGLLAGVKRRLAGTTAEREWRALRQAETRDVPAVRAVAVGVAAKRSGRSVLLTELWSGGVPLPAWWGQEASRAGSVERRAAVQSATECVADLLATAHQRGYAHRDGHAGNILVKGHAPGGVEAVFVDLLGGRFTRGPVSMNAAALMLAQLDQHFHRWLTRTERLRFLRMYLLRRGLAEAKSPHGEQLIAEVEHKWLTAFTDSAQHLSASLARRRDSRLQRNGKYFTTIQLGKGWAATLALQLERRHVFPENGVPDRTEPQWRSLLAPLPESAEDTEADAFGLAQDGLDVEAARPAGLAERVVWTLIGSPHRRMFWHSHQLRHRDKNAALLLGVLERRRAGLIVHTMLIRPARPSSTSLPEPRAAPGDSS